MNRIVYEFQGAEVTGLKTSTKKQKKEGGATERSMVITVDAVWDDDVLKEEAFNVTKPLTMQKGTKTYKSSHSLDLNFNDDFKVNAKLRSIQFIAGEPDRAQLKLIAPFSKSDFGELGNIVDEPMELFEISRDGDMTDLMQPGEPDLTGGGDVPTT